MFSFNTTYQQRPVYYPAVRVVAVFAANTDAHRIINTENTRQEGWKEYSKEPVVVFQVHSGYQCLPLSEFQKLYDFRIEVT